MEQEKSTEDPWARIREECERCKQKLKAFDGSDRVTLCSVITCKLCPQCRRDLDTDTDLDRLLVESSVHANRGAAFVHKGDAYGAEKETREADEVRTRMRNWIVKWLATPPRRTDHGGGMAGRP